MESKNIKPNAEGTIALSRLAANLQIVHLNLNSALLNGKNAESPNVFKIWPVKLNLSVCIKEWCWQIIYLEYVTIIFIKPR